MPKKLKTNETGIKSEVLVFEKPIIVSPSSSGNGEAITNAPKKKVSHLKDFSRTIDRNLLFPEFLIKPKMSSPNLSSINRKIIKSPHKAPRPPKMATRNTD